MQPKKLNYQANRNSESTALLHFETTFHELNHLQNL